MNAERRDQLKVFGGRLILLTIWNGAVSLYGHVPGHLLHPSLMRMNGNPGDVHLTALEMARSRSPVLAA
jgi:hypothetical protein